MDAAALHLEIQTSYQEGFELRLSQYDSGLFWIFKERVVTLVVLADLREDWRPMEDVFRVADFESRLRFPACKLIDRVDFEWQEDQSLPVQIARAQIAALRTASDAEGRFDAKWQLVRNLYEIGYNVGEVREVFRLIDWMMHLREDLSERFEQQLTSFEEGLEMPYVTSVERIWQARGVAATVVRQLTAICGPLSDDLDDRVRQLPIEKLEVLGEALLEFQSADDLTAWLDSNAAPH